MHFFICVIRSRICVVDTCVIFALLYMYTVALPKRCMGNHSLIFSNVFSGHTFDSSCALSSGQVHETTVCNCLALINTHFLCVVLTDKCMCQTYRPKYSYLFWFSESHLHFFSAFTKEIGEILGDYMSNLHLTMECKCTVPAPSSGHGTSWPGHCGHP